MELTANSGDSLSTIMKPESHPRTRWRAVVISATLWSAAQLASAGTPETSSAAAPVLLATATVVSPDQKVSVSDMAMTTNRGPAGTIATATITIRNNDGSPVAGALVTGAWSGLTTSSGRALTNRQGRATFHSARATAAGTFSFDLGSVTVAGASYDAARNLKVHDSISVSPAVTNAGLTFGNR